MSESHRAPKPKRNSGLTKPVSVSDWGPGPFSSKSASGRESPTRKGRIEDGDSHEAQPHRPSVGSRETASGEGGAANRDTAKACGQGGSQATRLAAIAEGADVFHSADGTGFVSVTISGHRETWPIKSSALRRYLARKFYEAERTAPNAQALKDAIGVVEARAQFDGREELVFVRVGECDGGLWLDLGDPDWRAVEVTTSGWRIVENPPIRFRRAPAMLPLPVPVKGGTVAELNPFLNVARQDKALVYAWIVAALRPRGPYPILNLHGEQGSAKSTMARVIRALLDPYKAPLRAAPRDERDLQITAKNSHVIALDNMSYLKPWLSDALCRLATGGGLGTRELYKNDEEIIFEAQRPVLLNGIEDLGTRGDFLERSIVIYLPEISDTDRQEEERFWADFEAARPRILGGLLDAVHGALRQAGSVHLEKKPRMADFAVWATAAEASLGLNAGDFMRAYADNRGVANDIALEFSPVAPEISRFLQGTDAWEGTAGELLVELDARAGDELRRRRNWPKSPRGLSGALRRLAPNLRSTGISVTFPPREAGTGRRLIKLENRGDSSSRPSPSSPLGDEAASRKTPRSHQLSQEPETSQVACSKKEAGDSCDGRDDKNAHLEVDL